MKLSNVLSVFIIILLALNLLSPETMLTAAIKERLLEHNAGSGFSYLKDPKTDLCMVKAGSAAFQIDCKYYDKAR